jgi:hypothetical protein
MATKKHSDVKMDKAVVKKAVHKHEKAMHPGKPLTKLAKGGKTKIRGCGAATKGCYAEGPMA